MNKNHLGKLLLFIFIFTAAFAFSSNKKLLLKKGENIVISPNKIGPGTWYIKNYDKESLELLEDIKKPFPSFIFRGLKPSKTTVELSYREKDKVKNTIYNVIILSKEEKRRKNYIRNEITKDSTLLPRKLEKRLQLLNNENDYYAYINKLYKMDLYEESLIAIDDFEIVFNKSSKIKELTLLRAYILRILGKYSIAVSIYENIIEDAKKIEDKLDALFLLSSLYKERKSYKKSKAILSNIIALSKDPLLTAKAYFILGEIYLEKSKYKAAIKQLENIVNKFPEERFLREKALYILSTIYYNRSEFQNYHTAYFYLNSLKEEFPYSLYNKSVKDKLKYIEENFINFF